MEKRPFFHKKIADLERLFDIQNRNPAFLNTLIGELQQRKTQRARELKARAVQTLGIEGKEQPLVPQRKLLQSQKETQKPSVQIKPASRQEKTTEGFIGDERMTLHIIR